MKDLSYKRYQAEPMLDPLTMAFLLLQDSLEDPHLSFSLIVGDLDPRRSPLDDLGVSGTHQISLLIQLGLAGLLLSNLFDKILASLYGYCFDCVFFENHLNAIIWYLVLRVDTGWPVPHIETGLSNRAMGSTLAIVIKIFAMIH